LIRVRADLPFVRPRLDVNQDRAMNFRLAEMIDPICALNPEAMTLAIEVAGDQPSKLRRRCRLPDVGRVSESNKSVCRVHIFHGPVSSSVCVLAALSARRSLK